MSLDKTHLLVVAERCRILLLHDEVRRVDELLGTDLWVLLVQWLGLDVDAFGVSSLDIDRNAEIVSAGLCLVTTTYMLSSAIAQYLGAIGSMTFLLVAQMLSHSSCNCICEAP